MAQISEQVMELLAQLIRESGLTCGEASWDDPPKRLAVYNVRGFQFAYVYVEPGTIVIHFPMTQDFDRYELCHPGAVERATEKLRWRGGR